MYNTNVVTSIVKLIVHSRVGYWPICSANKTTEEKEKNHCFLTRKLFSQELQKQHAVINNFCMMTGLSVRSFQTSVNVNVVSRVSEQVTIQ